MPDMPAMPGTLGRTAAVVRHGWPGAVDRPEPVKLAIYQSESVPVLLVDFSDNAHSYAGSAFEQLLFGSGTTSMCDCYLEASYGSLTIRERVAGWYRADQPSSCYLGDSFGIYGDFPHNSQGRVAAPVKEAGPYVDFSQFDHDHDGVVDESQSDNNNEKHPFVGILQAYHSPGYSLPAGDRRRDADLWKQSDTGVRTITVASPAFCDRDRSGAAIYGISGSDSVMTASMRIAPLFLGRVYSFPNPVIVITKSDRATIVYTPSDTERLSGQYPDSKVRIFDLAGEPISVLDKEDEVNLRHRAAYWDVKNGQGRPATSGVYFDAVGIEQNGVTEQNVGRRTVAR
jgi:hypothetical protein